MQPIVDWIHPACDASALAPPVDNPQSCNGPWAYSYQETWKNAAACGHTSVCHTHSSCPSWDQDAVGDGRGYDTADSSQTIHGFYSDSNTGHIGTVPELFCPAQATSLRNSLIATRPGISQPALNGFTVTWDAINVDPETTGCGPFDEFCETDVNYDCLLHVNQFPTEKTGVRDACPCAEFEVAVCPRPSAMSQQLTSSDVPKHIPITDPNGVKSTISVPAAFPGASRISTILISVNVSHTSLGDLVGSLIAPDGSMVTLFSNVSGAPHDVDIVDFDVSSQFAANSKVPGTWTLWVRDTAAVHDDTTRS